MSHPFPREAHTLGVHLAQLGLQVVVLLLELQHLRLQMLGLLCHRGLQRQRLQAAAYGCTSWALLKGFQG